MKNQKGDSNGSLKTKIWKAGEDYHLQTNDPKIARRIKAWSFSQPLCLGLNHPLYVFVIPSDKHSWVSQQLGLPTTERSEAQKRVTAELVQQGQRSRFGASHNGQEFQKQRPEAALFEQPGQEAYRETFDTATAISERPCPGVRP